MHISNYVSRMYIHMHPTKFRLFLTHDLVRAVLILTRYGIRRVLARKCPSSKISILNSSAILRYCSLTRAPFLKVGGEGWKLSETLAVSIRNWSMEVASDFQFKVEWRTVLPFSLVLRRSRRRYKNGRYFSKCLELEIMMLVTFAKFIFTNIVGQIRHSSSRNNNLNWSCILENW